MIDKPTRANSDKNIYQFLYTLYDNVYCLGKGNSRKEWIDNMIAESKKRKADKKKVEDELEEKTNALDDNWRDIFLKGKDGILFLTYMIINMDKRFLLPIIQINVGFAFAYVQDQ